MGSTKSWIEISEDRLRGNYAALARAAAGSGRSTSVLAVVKARAYGHGAELCARVLAAAGATWFGVTDCAEGVAVRDALPHDERRILIMCGALPEDASAIVRNELTPVVWTAEQIGWLAAGASVRHPLAVHLEIDTGMSRQGVVPGPDLDCFLDRLAAMPSLRLEGALTHFASAEIAGSPLTARQQQRFEAALGQIAARGLRLDWVHAGNSSMIDEVRSLPWLDRVAAEHGARPLVRSGLALYGYTLPLEGGVSGLRGELQRVLTWKTRVLSVAELLPGATVGYNATFAAPRPMRVALLPVGYADGVRRELSGSDTRPGGWMMLHGQRAPIVGRVSMNLTTVDVSAISGVAAGNEVTVLGEGVTADDHARLAGTIPYEILCGLRASARLIP